MMKIFNQFKTNYKNAFKMIFQRPVSGLFNILMLSVIIVLLIMQVTFSNAIKIWQDTNVSYPQIIVYLNNNSTKNDISSLENILNKYNKIISNYQFISKNEALNELQKDGKLKNITNDIVVNNENPLPDTFIINTKTLNSIILKQLSDSIKRLAFIDDLQLDMEYTNKVNELLIFSSRIIKLLQIFIIIAAFIIIYNIIRLEVLINEEEIIISHLIGAPISFIRKSIASFIWVQIIISSLLALIFTTIVVKYFNKLALPVNTIFNKLFIINQVSMLEFTAILITLILLSEISIFIAVKNIIKKIVNTI